MDPTAPRKAPDPKDLERLHRVQRRVISVLIITTVLHLTAGFVLFARYDVDPARTDAKVVLCLVGAAFLVGGIAATLVVNGRRWLSPWLLLGVVPAVVGIWWTCW